MSYLDPPALRSLGGGGPRSAGALALLGLLLISLSSPMAASREVPPTVLYRLDGASSFLSGCIEGPCLCPISLTYMAGTFGLTPAGVEGGFQLYAVSDVEWFTHANGEVWSQVRGSGSYRLGDQTQRLLLSLEIDGAEPIALDSGDVPRGAPFPAIGIAALTDGFCFQDGVDIQAAPATSGIQLTMVDPAMVTWSVAPEATAYDVVAGDLLQLRRSGGDFTQSSTACIGNDIVGTAVSLADPIASGQGIWFLVRGLPQPGYDSGGPGQVRSRDWQIAAAAMACP